MSDPRDERTPSMRSHLTRKRNCIIREIEKCNECPRMYLSARKRECVILQTICFLPHENILSTKSCLFPPSPLQFPSFTHSLPTFFLSLPDLPLSSPSPTPSFYLFSSFCSSLLPHLSSSSSSSPLAPSLLNFYLPSSLCHLRCPSLPLSLRLLLSSFFLSFFSCILSFFNQSCVYFLFLLHI